MTMLLWWLFGAFVGGTLGAATVAWCAAAAQADRDMEREAQGHD